jgi:hypothetical protein
MKASDTNFGFVGLCHTPVNMAARFLAGSYTVFGESGSCEYAVRKTERRTR